MSFRLVALLVTAIVAPAMAGTMFRLEIGPPIAAGTGTNVKKLKTKVVLVVRPLVCDDLATVQITGSAEGVVNGARQSVALDLIQLKAADGIYAVQQQWPAQGSWVLQLNGTCASPKASASTLVPMNKSSFIRAQTQVLREPATRQQVDAALASLVRSQS